MTPFGTTRRAALRFLAGSAAVFGGGALETLGAPAEERHFLPASQIQAAADYSSKRRGYAFLVKQHGKVIHESFANGGDRGQQRRIYSGTKGFWGLAALAAVEDGLISLDERVASTIPEWRGVDGKERITVRQLLVFTCGLERGLQIHHEGLEDRNAIALSRPMVSQPGRSFIYGPSALQVFHEVLKRKLAAKRRGDSPTRYLERRVLRPMGLGSQRYLADQKGNPLLAAGFVMTPAQWAKMGDVVLRNGAPVLQPATFARLTEGSNANGAYGFGFWNNKAAARNGREIDIEDMLEKDWDAQSWSRVCLCRKAPPDLVACIGSGYQRQFIIPSMGLIAIRQGVNAKFSDATFLRLLLGKKD